MVEASFGPWGVVVVFEVEGIVELAVAAPVDHAVLVDQELDNLGAGHLGAWRFGDFPFGLEEGGAGFAGGGSYCFDDLPDGGPVALDGVDPVLMYVLVPAPAILELGSGGEGVGGGVEVSAFVEGRVGGDEADGVGVDASQEGEVVAVEEGSVLDVEGGHGDRLCIGTFVGNAEWVVGEGTCLRPPVPMPLWGSLGGA